MFNNWSIHYLPILPSGLIAVITLSLLALLAYGSALLLRRQVPPRWVVILGSWRVLIIAVFALVLLQPVVSFTRPVKREPEMLVLVDTSESMALPGAGKGSRLDEVQPLLEQGELAAALRARYQLHWYTFDSSARPLDTHDLSGLKPTGTTTRIADALSAAWELARASGAAPERVLLVSDGNDLGGSDPVEAARHFGLTVDTLAPGSPAEGASDGVVAIADVQSARRVLLGSETHFRVSLRSPHSRGTAQPLMLRLNENGKEVWTGKVTFKPGSSEQRVAVNYRPTSAGAKQYAFRLDGAEANSTPFQLAVQVLDSKHEVLILEDTWRWEFKFLRRVFEDDPSFRFTATLSRGSGAFVQFGSPDRRVNLIGFPQGRAELEGFDTIILGDVDPKRWPRGLAATLADLVTEEGKSLIVIAGPNVGRLAEMRELHALLPVELTRDAGAPQEGPIDVQVSADGSQSPFFFKAGGADAKLPPLDQVYAPLRKRPGATILLEAAKKGNAYGNLIIAAEQTVGRGRVLFLGTDTLWKWQTLSPPGEGGTTPYRTFWQQTLRAMTPARPASSGVQLWLQADRSRYESGRAVHLRAEVESERPLLQPRLQATVVLPDDRQLPLAFAAHPAEPGVYTAEFVTAQAGPYRVQASITAEGKVSAEAATTLDVASSQAERDAVRIDAANLRRIAAATGGQVIDPARPETWPAGGERTREPAPEVRMLDLWNNATLLLVLCALLGVDWMLRLVRGYV
jgi:hypothetical protein